MRKRGRHYSSCTIHLNELQTLPVEERLVESRAARLVDNSSVEKRAYLSVFLNSELL